MQPSRDKGVKEFCVGVALFICVSLLSNFLLAGCLLPGFGGQSFASIAIFSACGVFAMLFLQAAFYQYILGGKGTYLVYALWLLVFFCALSNTFLNHIEFIRYGDAGFLPWAVETNIPFTRWLAGSAVLGWLYAIIQLLQIDISASELVKVAGSLVMAASSCLLVFRYPGRLAILISLLTPVWWIFISGYDEYYPFIAGAFVYSLAIFHYESLEGRPVFTAANAALLALLYIGFLPMSMLLVAKYFYQNRSARILSLILLVAFYLLGVAVFWPESIIDYFQSLPSDMNLGEKNTVYTPYIGQSISGNSPWFKPGYALSATHLLHLLHMQLWGGGWLIPCVFLLAFGSAIASKAWEKPIDTTGFLFLLMALLFQTFYFIFMIPKLGPIQDVDLFFTFYLALAFSLGAILDLIAKRDDQSRFRNYVLVSAVAGCGITTSYHLLWHGSELSLVGLF